MIMYLTYHSCSRRVSGRILPQYASSAPFLAMQWHKRVSDNALRHKRVSDFALAGHVSVRFYSTGDRDTTCNSIMNKRVFRASKRHCFTQSKKSANFVIAACYLSALSVASYYRKSWFNIPAIVGILFLAFLQFRRTRKREEKRLKSLESDTSLVEVDDYLAYLYQFLPLRSGSRVAGFLSETQFPRPILNTILNTYCWCFDVNLEEALQESLGAYRTIAEFFQRELKPSVRQIESHSPLVLPCDGRVLHYGRCVNGVVEQVKGVRYPVERFLGSFPTLKDPVANDLFYCVLYLAPGDYHLFHSPCAWKVDKVIHFPGTLMSVNPSVCKLVRNVLTLNERVLLSGTWEHGYFSYTAVGATNVGSIKINFLKDKIKTNKGFLTFEKDTQIEVEPTQIMDRGEMIGGFNFGSTIVLMFEAPRSFQFSFSVDDKVRLGTPLGQIIAPEDDVIIGNDVILSTAADKRDNALFDGEIEVSTDVHDSSQDTD